jgi:hypothetical protein
LRQYQASVQERYLQLQEAMISAQELQQLPDVEEQRFEGCA